jgi:hypothetical protein
MRKFIFGLVAVGAIVLVAGGIGVFWIARTGSALDAESRAYVDDAVLAISTHWNKDELISRAGPQLTQIVNSKPQELDSVFNAASVGLGTLTQYQGAKGEARMSATTQAGAVISANYIATAQYEKGAAQLRIALLKVDGRWKISVFFIDSAAMMNNLANLAGAKGPASAAPTAP